MGGIVVEVNFNTDIPRNLMYLIENQKTYIEKLFHTGAILDYSLSRDKKTLWIIFNGKTPDEVTRLMEGFPLLPYMPYYIKSMEAH
jgi:hypothetical protein